jgi:hypothetical protein
MSRRRRSATAESVCCGLSDEQVEEVKRRQQAIRDGRTRFATDEEMNALWKACGLEEIP